MAKCCTSKNENVVDVKGSSSSRNKETTKNSGYSHVHMLTDSPRSRRSLCPFNALLAAEIWGIAVKSWIQLGGGKTLTSAKFHYFLHTAGHYFSVNPLISIPLAMWPTQDEKSPRNKYKK